MNLPTLDNLRCFVAAAEHLNFRRAAGTVALTPTAFSQRIKQLEEQVGASLFERTTRRVRLTTAGASLLPEARTALTQARRCVEAVHADAEPPARFTLGTRFELGMSWLTPAILELAGAFPTWSVDLYMGSGPDILDRMLVGDVDCVVTSAAWARAGWTQHFLHVETYELVGAPELLADVPLESEADAAQHVLFDVDRALPLTRYLLDGPGPRLEWRDIRTVGAGAAMLRFVLAGQGVAVLPTYMCQQHLDGGRLVRLLAERELLSDTFRLIHASAAPLASTFERLALFLREQPLV